MSKMSKKNYIQIVFQASKHFTIGGMNYHSRVSTDRLAIIWNQYVNGPRNQDY